MSNSLVIFPVGGGSSSGGAVLSGVLASGSVTSGFIGNNAVTSGNIASGAIGHFAISSGAILSGQIGDNAVVSGSIASGSIASPHIASGFYLVSSGQVEGFFGVRDIASGTVGVFDLGSGAVIAGTVGSGAVVSGNIASGQIGQFSISSGAVTSGRLGITGTPDGTKFLRDDFNWVAPSASINSGNVQSGSIASGAVNGFFGPTRNINSGTVGVFDLGSGAVVAGTVGSGAVVSGNIASGQVGDAHLANNSIISGKIASGAITGFGTSGISTTVRMIASGTVGGSDLGNQVVSSGHIQSAVIDNSKLASGAVTSGRLGVAGTPNGAQFLRDDFSWAAAGGGLSSGAVGSGFIASGAVQGFFGTTRNIASGTVGVFDLGSGAVVAGTIGSGAVVSGNVASGQLSDNHFASGALIDGAESEFLYLPTLEMISGGRAVYRNFNGVGISNPTEQVKSPAIGVVTDNVLSGQIAKVITAGPFELSSGMFPYGPHFQRETIYVLNSGLLGNQAQTQFVDYTSGLTFQALGVFTSQSGGMVTPNFNQKNTLMANAIVSGAVVQNAGASIFKYPDQGNILTEYQFTDVRAGEAISGVRAVIIASGNTAQVATVLMAKAGDPFKMPAMGILIGNYLSGDIIGGTLSGALDAGILVGGTAFLKSSDTTLFSGKTGVPLFVGLSGELNPSAPSLSGSLVQSIGLVANWGGQGSGSAVLSIGYRPVSGDITALRLASGLLSSISAVDGNASVGAIKTVSGSYIVASGDYTVLSNMSGASGTITVPAAALAFSGTISQGRIMNIKKIDPSTNAMTIVGASGELIDNATSGVAVTSQFQSMQLQSDGTSYWIL